jgi:hypothetical protein
VRTGVYTYRCHARSWRPAPYPLRLKGPGERARILTGGIAGSTSMCAVTPVMQGLSSPKRCPKSLMQEAFSQVDGADTASASAPGARCDTSAHGARLRKPYCRLSTSPSSAGPSPSRTIRKRRESGGWPGFATESSVVPSGETVLPCPKGDLDGCCAGHAGPPPRGSRTGRC